MARFVPPSKDRFRRQFGVKEFWEKRHHVLVNWMMGGLGDLLMLRMIFEDMKIKMPEARITLACPLGYHPVVTDHPFIDEVVDCRTVEPSKYLLCYNTASVCERYEESIAPRGDLHRSDIYAMSCGLKLTRHNMHFRLPESTRELGRHTLRHYSPDESVPTLVLCPISSQRTKDLMPQHLVGLVEGLKKMGFAVVGLHTNPIPLLEQMGVPVIHGRSLTQWMGLLNAADYVISTDTAAVHFAGGIGKPLVGIFTFADSKIYCRHYDKVELVQKHRDNGDWPCGPCYDWSRCTRTDAVPKPCLTELTAEDMLEGARRLIKRFPWEKKPRNDIR